MISLSKVSTWCVNYLNNNLFWCFIAESVTSSQCVPSVQLPTRTLIFTFLFSHINHLSFFIFSDVLSHLTINKTLVRQHMSFFSNTDYSCDYILLKTFRKSVRHWTLCRRQTNMTKKNSFFPDRASRLTYSTACHDIKFS
jgi:hypothetical protein